jgi:pimeloyl-ACP methyl ester carboxylesterase
MTNLYLKGMNTTKKDLNVLIRKFENENVILTPLYESYNNLHFQNQNTLEKTLQEKIKLYNFNQHGINLICHSMGCNLGTIIAENTDEIDKLVLLSPEFFCPKNDEKKAILKLRENNNLYGETLKNELFPFSIFQIKDFLLFKQTQPLAKAAIEKVTKPTLIIYSQGDPYVSTRYMRYLSVQQNIESYTIASCNHNPVLAEKEGQKVLTLIKDFLK